MSSGSQYGWQILKVQKLCRKIQLETWLNVIANILSSIIMFPLTGWLKAILGMRRISSGGRCPVYHFLFSFPRASAAPRQVSECVTMMVTMVLWKASCPGFWACALHQPLYPLLPNDSGCFTQNQPIRNEVECPGPCQNVASSGFIWSQQKST